MIKSPVQMYTNGRNWSMLMHRCSGIETSILRRSPCVFYSHSVKILLNWSVKEGNREGMYMHANTWSRLPKICYLLTCLLTPWSRVLLEKLASLQLVKKFTAFYGTRRFLTALTSARHLSLSWASPIQSSYPNTTSWRSILILSSHLRLGLPSGLFPSGFPTSTLYTPLPSPM